MGVLIVREQELKELVKIDAEVIAGIEASFISLSQGKAIVPPIMMLPVAERQAEIDVKSAFVAGLDSLAVKIASGFFLNHQMNLPTSSGLMVVMSTVTGFPQAVLLDNGYLTHIRTAAAGAIAAEYLADAKADIVGIVGVGEQARHQLRALSLVRKITKVLVHGRRADAVQGFIEAMKLEIAAEFHAVTSLETLVVRSAIVITTTPSREPLIRAEWLHPGLHITALGADSEEKRELFDDVLERADVIGCDLKEQCLRLGELRGFAGRYATIEGKVRELGEICSGRLPGRTSDTQITVCDLTGVGTQDTQIALLAHDRAVRAGIGIEP